MAAAVVIALAILLLNYGDGHLRRWLRLNSDQLTRGVAATLHAASATQPDPDALIHRFEEILAQFANCTRVRVLNFEAKTRLFQPLGIRLVLLEASNLFTAGWLSTDSLSRASGEAQRRLRPALTSENLALLVCPEWARRPQLLVAFGCRENELTYTQPEIELLRELAEVVNSLYTEARLTLQARQAEQLAMLGRLGVSIAHELRNPMETLKVFSHLLPERLTDRTFLEDFSTVVPREADRIEGLAQQLLDLANPRASVRVATSLNRVVEQTVLLSLPHVCQAGVTLTKHLMAIRDVALIDENAIRQVITNLLRNAMEALSANERDRHVAMR